MPRRLTDYMNLVGGEKISEIYRKASQICTKHIVHINATYYGGGVAEILRNIVPLMADAGLEVGWRAMPAHPDFFRVTKKFHNALQGEDINLTLMKKKVYEGVNEEFSKFTHIDHDLVVVHDPQPLPLITFYKKKQPWIWRCHIDLSNPNEELWDYLRTFGISYDHAVYHMDKFAWKGGAEHSVMYPSIDPLSTKNVNIGRRTIEKYLKKVGVSGSDSTPLVSQISRFDMWKDPVGTLQVFDLIEDEMDCKFLMLGSIAADDPEGQKVYERVHAKAKDMENVNIAVNVHDILINAVQRASDVVVQKSLTEGFGLTVSEALWKGTPVVGSNVGGVPAQIINGKTGYLIDPNDHEEVANKVMDLLADDNLREIMGKRGKRHVIENFLITRHIEDWIDLWTKFFD